MNIERIAAVGYRKPHLMKSGASWLCGMMNTAWRDYGVGATMFEAHERWARSLQLTIPVQSPDSTLFRTGWRGI